MNPVEEFLALDSGGLQKEASDWRGAAFAVGTPLAAMAAYEGYQGVKNMVGRAVGFKRMMKHNPGLKKLPAAKTRAMFNTLHNAAPDLARDPVVASSFVNRMALQDDYVDPRTLADLGSAQQKISRPGMDFPIAQVTSAMVSEYGDPRTKQLDRRARSADVALGIAQKQQELQHRKVQDAAAEVRNRVKDSRDEALFQGKKQESLLQQRKLRADARKANQDRAFQFAAQLNR